MFPHTTTPNYVDLIQVTAPDKTLQEWGLLWWITWFSRNKATFEEPLSNRELGNRIIWEKTRMEIQI